MLRFTLTMGDQDTWRKTDPRPMPSDQDWAALRVSVAKREGYCCQCCGLRGHPAPEALDGGFEVVLTDAVATFVEPDPQYSRSPYDPKDYSLVCPYCWAHHYPVAKVLVPYAPPRPVPVQLGFSVFPQGVINSLAAYNAVGNLLARADTPERKVHMAMVEPYERIRETALDAVAFRNPEWREPGSEGYRTLGSPRLFARYMEDQSFDQRKAVATALPDLRVLPRSGDAFFERFVRALARHALKKHPKEWVSESLRLTTAS